MLAVPLPRSAFRTLYAALFLACGWMAAAALPASAQQQVVAGQNVNMVGGPWSFDPANGRIVGDPFLQRQNEPSLALSSRNPCHILAGANDYRAVDVPGLTGDQETGDAWLGLFKSIDCGQSWTSTLLPGYPQDRSAEGLASPIKGLAAGADATVRPGPAGMIYYSGLAFDRGTKNLGKVFVSRFIDSNNKEQGDPFTYLGTAQIDMGTSGQFLDKPWIAADIPRSGGTCSVNGQTIPAGNVYIAYTSFTGGSNNPRSKIMFSSSSNCGATWSNPAKLSERIALNQGTVMAVNPADGAIFIAWREFADPALDPNALSTVHGILFVRSTDGGKSFTKAAPIDSALYPFDQGSSAVSFRSNAYPTMAVDGSGRIYVAWAARGFSTFPGRSDPKTGDARIVMSTSGDGGATWSMPRAVVDNYPGPGHQIMPAMTFAAGKLVIAYYDFREDEAGVYGKYVDESQVVAGTGRRHTIELRAAMADPAAAPVFTDYTSMEDNLPRAPSTRVTKYLFGNYQLNGATQRSVQLQYNPPNLPIFARGTTPFIGDYIDIAGQTFTIDATRTWRFNTDADTSGRRVPMFHVSWADNRDVRRPRANQTWADYKSPSLGPNGQICDGGSNPGSRNQNIYTAPLTPGLLVTAPGNQKTVNQSLGIQRAFVVYARNTTSLGRYYVLSMPALPTGVYGSFRPIDESLIGSPGGPQIWLQLGPIFIPARSSIARSVFVLAPGGAIPQINVDVTETNVPAGSVGAAATVLLNPDIANPDIANPDIANPDIANPDIANAEVYNPDIANPDIANPDIANPDIANPDIANPDIANPDIANATMANPDIANPDIANPDIANPDIANPDIANPDIANPDIANFSVTDVSWRVTNTGNTTAAYAFRAKLKRLLPAGAKLQLIVRRVYIAPQASLSNACGDPLPAIQNQVLVNIPNPVLNNSLSATFDPAQYDDNASFFLLPGAQGRVTLRVFCPKSAGGECPTPAQAATLASARVVSQAPNNCPAGVTSGNCAVNDFNPDDIYDPGDALAPVVSTPASFTVEAGSAAGATVTFSASAQDDVSGALTATCVPASGAMFPLGATTVTCSATDGDGNTGSASFTVTVADTTGPVLATPPNITGVQATLAGGAPVSYTVTAADVVSGAIVPVCAPASGATFPLGTSTVNCSATDAAGNTTAASFTVTVVDTIAPTIGPLTFPPGFSPDQWYAGSSITATLDVTDGSSVSIQCVDSAGGTSVSGSTITIAGDGIHLVSCTVTDAGGNSSDTVATTVKLDGTAPTASGPTVQVNAEATSAAGAVVTYAFTGSDATSGVSLSCAPPSGSTFPVGTTGVICRATDGAGNVAEVTFSVKVTDTTPPAITVNGGVTSLTLDAGAAFVNPGALASDLVDGTVSVTVQGTVDPEVPGVYPLIYTATDASGNRSTFTVTVTVVDGVAPVVTVPGALTAEATSAAGAAVNFPTSALDAVSGEATVSCAPASGSTFPLGKTRVTCSASDPSGNSSSASFDVTVVDTTQPRVTPPAAVVAEATGPAGAAVTYGPATATDAVTPSLTVTCTPARGTTFPVGLTTVGCSATDGAGNTGTASFTVTVRDTTKPVLTLPAPITVEMTGPAGNAVAYTATATDLVTVPLAPVCAPASGSLFARGITTVTCTATDAAGNSTSGSFTITVRDTIAPTVTAALNPTMIWSPNGAMVPVTVSGRVTDGGSGVDPLTGVTYAVKDEYNQLQPSGAVTLAADGSYSFVLSLQASRKGSDKNGRTYTVTITATDRAGLKKVVTVTEVAVEHNQ